MLPGSFQVDDPAELQAFMAANAFVTLVSQVGGELFASHLPVVVKDAPAGLLVEGHLARANPHWHGFLEAAPESLMIFSGPHAYISPRHYGARESVPTWNYQAVHAYGVPCVLEDRERLESLMAALVASVDPSYQNQWDGLSKTYRSGMMKGVVAFEMRVTRLFGKYKLSQNRPRADRERVAAALEAGSDALERAVGAAMRVSLEEG